MAHSAQERKFILITGILVLVAGFVGINSIEIPTEQSQLTDRRSPASVPTQVYIPSEVTQVLVDSWQVDLNCGKASSMPETLEVQSETIKISGKNCFKDSLEQNFEVVNESNGFTGSVFALPQGRFQTDFVQLVKGNNRLRVKIGSVWKEITVISRR